MSETLSLPRLLEYILRVISGSTAGQKRAAQVEIEYYDEDYRVRRRSKAKSIRVEQSEHGPLTLVISTVKEEA